MVARHLGCSGARAVAVELLSFPEHVRREVGIGWNGHRFHNALVIIPSLPPCDSMEDNPFPNFPIAPMEKN